VGGERGATGRRWWWRGLEGTGYRDAKVGNRQCLRGSVCRQSVIDVIRELKSAMMIRRWWLLQPVYAWPTVGVPVLLNHESHRLTNSISVALGPEKPSYC